ncbi:uncharacterized protein LOC125536857 [Triticum urartu]|uniref:uncharacterized protein LOC125536857 n=1 Tax=Triticum urartu TaxID=4572 RepID=UPI002044CB35|nr:uncharacterized protein LOC125536857 [Triticum urartu]
MQQQQPALLGTGGGGEHWDVMMEDTLMSQGELASIDAPRFDGADFESWQVMMRGHLAWSHPLVWSIVETGFSCADEANPTDLELRKMYYNAQAMNAIHSALSDDRLYRIWHLDTAKEVWDALQVMHEDTPTVRRLKIKQLREKMRLFAWRKGESADQMHTRLWNLAIDLNRLGCKEVDDPYVVWTMLRAMAPRKPAFVDGIRREPGFEELTPLDVLHNFQVYDCRQELSRILMRGTRGRSRTLSRRASPPTMQIAPEKRLASIARAIYHGSAG